MDITEVLKRVTETLHNNKDLIVTVFSTIMIYEICKIVLFRFLDIPSFKILCQLVYMF